MLHVTGTNSEQGYIGGAICAERSALMRLRFLENPELLKVIVVTDSETAISPGLLCREYLMSHANVDVPIVLGNASSSIVSVSHLGALYPWPYLYRFQNRHDIAAFALKFANNMHHPKDSVTSDNIAVAVYDKARSCTCFDRFSTLHPIKFAATVHFDNGDLETAWQLKGLEYGCTLDAVSQLIRDMEKRRITCAPCHSSSNNDDTVLSTSSTSASACDPDDTSASCYSSRPTHLVMLDQFGVAHAPFAQARALLTEHGYGALLVLVHDDQGQLHLVPCHSLAPQPENGKLLTHSDFC